MTSTRATTSECATTSDECAAQSFVRALRAYHGTLSPRWGPTSDQCEIVRARAARLPWNARPPVGLSPTSSGSVPAPSSRPIQERAASCSSPPTHPPRCGAVARSEKINLALGQKSTYDPAMLAHAAAQGLPHAGGTQWYALSATSMSLVAWHGAQSNGRVIARTATIVAARE